MKHLHHHSINVLWVAVAGVVILAALLIGTNFIFQSASLTAEYSNPTSIAPVAAEKQPVVRLVPPGGAKIDSVSGQIASLSDGEQLVIHHAKLSPNPLDPQGPAERTVIITDQTKIVALVPLSSKEQGAALKKYQNAVKAGEKDITPPVLMAEHPISADDLKLTMEVTVTSADDIRNAETITAETISFVAPPSTPPLAVK